MSRRSRIRPRFAGCAAALLLLTGCSAGSSGDVGVRTPEGGQIILGPFPGPGKEHREGYGEVKPETINNGGTSTGVVNKITWTQWGEEQAIGHGTATYRDITFGVNGRLARATVVAFDLGPCNGRLAYRAVVWYFPSEGQWFDPRSYRDTCTGESHHRRVSEEELVLFAEDFVGAIKSEDSSFLEQTMAFDFPEERLDDLRKNADDLIVLGCEEDVRGIAGDCRVSAADVVFSLDLEISGKTFTNGLVAMDLEKGEPEGS